MEKEGVILDIVCQVLVHEKSKELVYAVLNEFIPSYEPINLDYTGKPDDEFYKFQSEEEMLDYYIKTPNIQQVFYWNKWKDNPDRIMVGVNILDDDQMVFSLTIDGTYQTEATYYKRLKQFLNSDIGVISYVNPAEYLNGEDFKMKYEFE